MLTTESPDVAGMYHLNSSNTRARVLDLRVDLDRRPFRRRTYPESERIKLPSRDFDLGSMTLGEALRRRTSTRDFKLEPFALATLGRLLHVTYGIRGMRKVDNAWSYHRPAPSAGGLYPLELYVATQMVNGLEDGIYHYDAHAHELERRASGMVHAEIAAMTIGQDMIREVNVVVMISAIMQRTTWKYGQRGYRYVWIEAGHVAQNFYLAGAALRLGVVTIGGFFDAELNRLFRLPDAEEQAIYLVCLGHAS